ncbi:MAG: aspartate/glutamate racemase family protein [Anaerolineales bacterium]|jgi:aspartate racemase
MQTIGLLGGMSWESTVLYYRRINTGVKARLGGLHSARVAMVSVDFQEIETLQQQGAWDRSGEVLGQAARSVEAAGADFLLICTNTMHRVAPQIEAAINIPVLHIADATAEAINKYGIQTVGLLGTRFTMEQEFYAGRLRDRHGLKVLVPPQADRELVHEVIYSELVLGNVRAASRDEFVRIIKDLQAAGAQGVIAGCTEIGMLVQQEHISLLLFDTTLIHADAAVERALRLT